MENNAVKPLPAKPASKVRHKQTEPRLQLDPQRWVETAIDLLAREGLSGLRVEVLAKHCGVTKGSFYWHFKDRRALLDAVLDYWREGRIRDIEKTTALVDVRKAREQLQYVIDVYGASRNRRGMAIELAMRDWARRDAQAAAVVEAVDLYRLECTRRLFVASGLSDAEAKSRSVLLYACVFGLSMMHYSRFDNELPALRQRISERIVGA